MNSIMPENHYSKEYSKHFYQYQPTCKTSVLYEGFKMDANQNEAEEFRSIPPLIPVETSPPPLCNIPKEMRGNNSFEFRRFSNMQQHPEYNATFTQKSLPPTLTASSDNREMQHTTENTSHTIANTRKRKSENTNRELIDMVKKQLEQLNKTLAALERNNDCDSDFPPGGHLTPPNDRIDQIKGKKIIKEL